ncbi:MAG: heparinase II/III family protein, partial [Armatimonadota bacterium]
SGVSRWEYALTHCCFFIEALYNCSGIDLRNHPSIVRTSKFAARCLSPMGRDIIQIDQGLPLKVSNPVSGPLSKLLAKWYKDPLLGWGIFNTLEDSYTQAFDLMWYDPTIPISSPEEENEKSVVFEDIGWVVMRSGWKENDNMVAFQCTPYWPGYHHLDQCTYQIFAHGKEIVLDSGLGWRAHPNYFDRYRDSVAHNVILIDGEGQLKHSSESGCKMLKTELSDFVDYACGDGTNSYDKTKKFIRSILFLKPNIIVIRDQIELDRPRQIEWLMHGNGGNFEMHLLGSDRGFSLIDEDIKLEGFILLPERWVHNQKRGYKLTDWQTRHEVTHPVLSLVPDKSSNYEFLIVIEIDNLEKQRMIPGGIADDGSLSLVTSNYQCTIKPADFGFEYTIHPF